MKHFIADELILQTLQRITEGICHPLRVRVEHVLLGEENSEDCILLQDIYVLLQDYNEIISQVTYNKYYLPHFFLFVMS